MFVFAAILQILHLFNNSNAQDLEVNIKLDASQPQIVTIEGKRKAAKQTSRNLSFLTSIAGQKVSGERISNLKLFDSKGMAVAYKRFIPGEYVAESEFTGWSYQVDLTPPKDQKLMARVSWVADSAGIFMLNDMLPQFRRNEITKTKIVFDVATLYSWPVSTAVEKCNPITYFASDVSKSVFYIGQDWKGAANLDPPGLQIELLDDFQFIGVEALQMAEAINGEYSSKFGVQALPIAIAIAKFSNGKLNEWDAETRGRNITIFTSHTSFKSQALQQLHEQLRHEMFHLWIPNGMNVTGNYDWFYEGFALYQSLKTGVALNRIRFDDYLDTLSRAYDIDRAQKQKVSLIEASKNRWTGDNNTQIYARGMLVAFLCDLALLEKSKGKRSVTNLLRKLYEDHKPPNIEEDGNEAVLKLLRSNSELIPIIDRNITGAESVDWSVLIKAAGLEVDLTDKTTNLKVTAKPSGRQKDLLDKLGYNSWRKLSLK